MAHSLDDLAWPEVEVLHDDLEQLALRVLAGAVVEDGDGDGLGHAYRVRYLVAQKTCVLAFKLQHGVLN